ncbi:MAG: tetratricopeptide repeat protein [Deltaproteobacteria bacterium]|nr:tetratricopeptide repeat protein [Deltaproteobacteria bacterium]
MVLFFFLAIGLAIYSNTFNVPPHYDDRHVFVDSTFQDILNRCTLAGKRANTRVIAELSFAFNYWLAGPDVLGYHIVNLLIHVCTAFLVYHLLFVILCLCKANKTSGGSDPLNRGGIPLFPLLNDTRFWPAFFGALIFLAHPLATQSVTYISQRYTSLATLFYVAAVVCYLKARSMILCGATHRADHKITAHGVRNTAERRHPAISSKDTSTATKGIGCRREAVFLTPDAEQLPHKKLFFSMNHLAWYTLSVLTATLAMLTKEMALTLPVVLVLIEFFFVQHDLKGPGKRLLYLLPLLMTGLIIPYVHLVVLKAPNLDAITESVSGMDKLLPRWAPEQLTRQTYFFSQLGIIWGIYLRLLVWPFGQNIEHDFHVSSSLFDNTTLVACLGIMMLAAFALWVYRRSRLISLGILWFFVTLSVTSSIIPNKIFVAEHRVYLSMIALAFIIADIYRYTKRPRLFWSIAIPIIVTLAILTFMRNRIWQDELTLWADAIKKSPGLSRPYNNYGEALHKAGRLDEAIAAYKKVLAMPYIPLKTGAGHNPIAMHNLGVAYAEKGMYEEALKYYQAVIEQAPDSAANTYFNMGNLFRRLKQYGKAIQAYQKSLEINPQNACTCTNLGGVWMSLEMYDDAEAVLKKAVRLNPRTAEAYLSLGSLYSLNPLKRKEAVAHYRRYLALRPNTPLREKVLEKIRRLEGGLD